MADTTHSIPVNAKKAPLKKRSPYVGVTREGIKLLRPKGRVDNITLAQARRAVAILRAERLAAKNQD